jgi:hypothetical protein
LGRYLSLEGTPVPERHDVQPVPPEPRSVGQILKS